MFILYIYICTHTHTHTREREREEGNGFCELSCLDKPHIPRTGCQDGQGGNSYAGTDAPIHR